jgi:ribosome-associated protein
MAKNHADMVKRRIEAILDENKAEDIVALDLEGKTCIADYMIIASGRSGRHVAMLADRIAEFLKEAELYYIPPEGKDNCDWVVVDAGDIVVHLFRPEIRDVYNLEKMWSVALPVTNLEVVG